MKYNTSLDILQKNIGMNLIQFFVNQLNRDADLCLFGWGRYGKAIFEYIRSVGIPVCCICDNNWRHMEDDTVVSPQEAVRDNPHAVFIVSSRSYSYEMELQLLMLGVEEERIISFNSSVEMSYRGLLPEHAYGDMVSAMHYEITGIYPNLNEPSTFNEKMMASMIKTPKTVKIDLADKFKVRFWVAEKIGEKYLIPLVGDWKRIEDIPWEGLPPKYVLKLNHGSGFNIISDGNNVDIGIAKRKLSDWLKCNFGYMDYERQYVPIEPRIICEEYIENHDGDVFDYKIFCFHGNPQYIMFLSERKKGLRMLFFDLNWNVMPFVYSYPRGDFLPLKPERFEEMLEVTRILCKCFDQVRVDWYVLNDGSLKFGEMTFTSMAGHAKWEPSEWDMRLGEMW